MTATLPDFALTTYEGGGSLPALVETGLLEEAEYLCPECDGRGRHESPTGKGYRLCRTCWGAQRVLVSARGLLR